MSYRAKKSIRAKFLRHAKAVTWGRLDVGPTAPIDIFLRWEDNEGLAAAAGREVTAVLSLEEVKQIVGALPAWMFDGDSDAFAVYVKFIKWLEAQAQARS